MSDELFTVEDSPHWPIGRARAVRDALAARLAERMPALKTQIAALQFLHSADDLVSVLKGCRKLRRPRMVLAFRRYLEVSRLVVALEQSQSPPAEMQAAA